MNINADYDKLLEVACANDLAVLYDSGEDGDDRGVVFGDDDAKADWGSPDSNEGYTVVVNLDLAKRFGGAAHAARDGVVQGEIAEGDAKTGDERLESVMIMLSAPSGENW